MRRALGLALTVLVGLAVVGWVAARQIRSPARIAAETAPPAASPITVPVVRRTLATEVIVRGTVRYGAPQSTVLATSELKTSSTSDIVTQPPRRQATLSEGDLAMTVDGRPVFVLAGPVPMHRDLGRGDRGPDVLQYERALARLGYPPGAVDGRYDVATARATSRFYLARGFDPFGPTDLQLEQLRTAEAAAAQARDANLQAVNALEVAQRGPKPTDVAQARIDVVTARDTVANAELAVSRARARLDAARATGASAPAGEGLAAANDLRDQAAASADVAAKQNALNAAVDEARLAQLRRFDVPLDAPLAEREAAQLAIVRANEAVAQAQADLSAAVASFNAIKAAGASAVRKAKDDTAKAGRDIRVAAAELRRAQLDVRAARQQASLAAVKVGLFSRREPTGTLARITSSTAREASRTRGEVSRLATKAGIQVPANEIVFYPSLPLRVDTVKARRGSQVSGSVMSVTGSRLKIDSSLSVADAKLVQPGDPVIIEEQDLGVRARGRVDVVASSPGTNRVDPSRFYFSVTPTSGLPSLVGASVKLTIAVRSSEGAVLAVPASALSVGGDGNARVQVTRRGRSEHVTVVPGLAAEGLVEVRVTGNESLGPGTRVVVGARGGRGALATGGAPRGP